MGLRLLVGLGAAGVDRVLLLPAADGLSTTLHRPLRARGQAPFPVLEELDVALDGTARDSTIAVERMVAAGVRAIAVLGGDGTHRGGARGRGDVPICALSTGTNNAFPEMRETTVAGIATGLVATGRAGDGGGGLPPGSAGAGAWAGRAGVGGSRHEGLRRHFRDPPCRPGGRRRQGHGDVVRLQAA